MTETEKRIKKFRERNKRLAGEMKQSSSFNNSGYLGGGGGASGGGGSDYIMNSSLSGTGMNDSGYGNA